MKKHILIIIITAVCIFSVIPIKLFSADNTSSGGGTSDSQQSSSGQKKGGGQDGSSDSSGSIKAGDKTGTIESYVLATGAAHRAARRITNSILPKLKDIEKVIILDDTMRAQFNGLVAFRVNNTFLTLGYQDALDDVQKILVEFMPKSCQLQECITKGGKKKEVPYVSEISGALQSLAQLGSLLKTDVAVNGVDVNLPDEIIIDEVSSQLLRLKKEGPTVLQVIRPTLYFAPVMTREDHLSDVIKPLNSLYQLRNRVEGQIKYQLEDLAYAEKGCSDRPECLKEIQNLKTKLSAKKDELNKLNTQFDSFIGSLISSSRGGGDVKPDGQKQPSPITNNIFLGSSTDGDTSGKKLSDKKSQAASQPKPSLADLAMAQLLLNQYLADPKVVLLTLQIQQAGGGYLAKNNLWTFFGAWPLRHSGGIVVTFSLISPVVGNILASGAIPYYKGFFCSQRVEDEVDKLMEYESKKKE
ncbi:MAG: hypothetical protein ABSB10_04835 [Candidatus Bathyarchaeia archaeon]|jgi:hypothetical protein